VRKLGRGGQARDVTLIECMCFACWIDKATEAKDTHSCLLLFHGNNPYMKASRRYVYTYISHLVLFHITRNISVHCTGIIHTGTLDLKHVVYISTTKLYIVKQNIVKYLLDLALSSSSVKSMTLRSTLDLPGVFDCCLLLSCDV